MSKRPIRTRQTLLNKFRFAGRGLRRGVRSESNFFVHLFMAAAVIAAGSVLKCSPTEWCLLALAISTVLSAEMMNTALEHLAKAITERRNTFIGDALDMASASVLLASLGAATVGVLVLGGRLATLLGWWPK
jgi:diacylglycerol kinase (ATP)